MIDAKGIVPVSPFDAEDERTAARLGIELPELWITERYEERLGMSGLSIEINPDELIRAYDRLDIGGQRKIGFGALFDSLGYDDGAETDRIYEIDEHFFSTSSRTSDLPFFRVLSDPTPTTQEQSAELATVGFLLGSVVVDKLVLDGEFDDFKAMQKQDADEIRSVGSVVNLTAVTPNIVNIFTSIYEGVPILGMATGFIASGIGISALIIARVKSDRLLRSDIHKYVEKKQVEAVEQVAEETRIISFVPDLGGTSGTHSTLKAIRQELNEL